MNIISALLRILERGCDGRFRVTAGICLSHPSQTFVSRHRGYPHSSRSLVQSNVSIVGSASFIRNHQKSPERVLARNVTFLALKDSNRRFGVHNAPRVVVTSHQLSLVGMPVLEGR
jgi:hypothetical protein